MKGFLGITILLIGVISCTPEDDDLESLQQSDFLDLPIDTTAILEDLNISESINQLDYSLTDTLENSLAETMDTLELRYIAYACDCQSWVIPNKYDSSDFDLDEHGYYIEPVTEDLEIIWNAMVSGNVVKFIGKEYNEVGYPSNAKFMDPNPPLGKVFRYYSYEIQKPYKVWGPRVFREVSEISGDSLSEPSVLTVSDE